MDEKLENMSLLELMENMKALVDDFVATEKEIIEKLSEPFKPFVE